MSSEPFDHGYYSRFYESDRSRVHGASEVASLCTAVTAMMQWWGVPLASALDVGAGVGLWRDWFSAHRPQVAYRSVEVSRYACAKYGHERRDITKWRAQTSFDLVICQGVLPYLDDASCERAIGNLAAMTGGVLYLEAITRRDMKRVVDAKRTDMSVFGRTAAWYRQRLRVHYTEVGCGLWAKKDAGLLFYDLERSPRVRASARASRSTVTRGSQV